MSLFLLSTGYPIAFFECSFLAQFSEALKLELSKRIMALSRGRKITGNRAQKEDDIPNKSS